MMAQVEWEEEQVSKLESQGIKCNYFWKLSQKPKNLEIGDKCYFVWDKAIRAWHEVIGFAENMTCETTGIHHPGYCIVLESKINEIDPVPMDGFRGFRYARNLDQ